MTELWVTLMAAGAWALGAGSAGFVGSFIVQRIRHRLPVARGADDLVDAGRVERAAATESGPAPASHRALVLVHASGPAYAGREAAPAASTAA